MTNRERVYAAFQHRQPDRTPYMVGFTQKALAAVVAYYGSRDFLQTIDNCIWGLAAAPGPKAGQIDASTWQDEFGVRWDRSIDPDIGNVCNCLLPERNIDRSRLFQSLPAGSDGRG